MKFILCIVVFFLTNEGRGNSPEKVFLSVYYESKCPDSEKFILQQLEPAMKLLHKHLSLRLIPFGKAKSLNLGQGGFECQHGPTECKGNLVQECALDFMRGWDDTHKLAYVACEMKTQAGTRGDMKCVENAGIPTQVVEKCISSEQGLDLQLQSEFLTMIVRPSFIPTVIADGLFDQEFQDHAQVNLVETLCSRLWNTRTCLHYHNRVAMQSILSNSPLIYNNN